MLAVVYKTDVLTDFLTKKTRSRTVLIILAIYGRSLFLIPGKINHCLLQL
ncbi:hypothetical protein HanPSC8_Chr06g0247141 [Helianthus annuus]|nr:hypothetical protein HanPSC8_Chr06g0247141 [Helianthus annuus]